MDYEISTFNFQLQPQASSLKFLKLQTGSQTLVLLLNNVLLLIMMKLTMLQSAFRVVQEK